MCDWRYGFLRCDAGFLHGKDAPAWAKWCPRCNGPTLVKEARDVSLVAFQQALALCAGEPSSQVGAWVRIAEWPVTIPTGVDGETIVLTHSEAEALWNDALAAAPRTDDSVDTWTKTDIVVASVINHLTQVNASLALAEPYIHDVAGWATDARSKLATCIDRLSTLTKPKELT